MTSDVAVIGAGPAGAAISAILSQAGFSVTVLEKSRFPRFSIGESLLPQSMVFLKEAGLLDAIPPDLFQLKKGALFARGTQKAKIDFSDKFTAGPPETWQVSRADFDQKLIEKSVEYGTEVIFDAEVNSVDFGSDLVTISFIREGIADELSAKFIVDASGGAMVLPRLLNNVSQPDISKASLFRHYKGDSRNQEESENILIAINPNNKKIWYWAIPLKDNIVSVGVVSDQETLNTYKGSLTEQFDQLISEEPNITSRLKKSIPIRTIDRIQGYEAKVDKLYGPQFLLIGNAGGFIDPIFSSGITVALKSAVLGAKEIIKQLNAEQPDWESYAKELNVGNKTFRAYVDAWYEGTLQDIILMTGKDLIIQKKINSILAGYVWDQNNTFVKEPKRKLSQVARVILRFEGRPKVNA